MFTINSEKSNWSPSFPGDQTSTADGVCCFLGGKMFGIQRAEAQTTSLQSSPWPGFSGAGRTLGPESAPLTHAYGLPSD